MNAHAYDLSIPRIPCKQIELWDIASTSGNFQPYQIQTANIHFNVHSFHALLITYAIQFQNINQFI